ncbi:OmpA family protein, partial [Winogradskyella sp.]|nr:OmpA family protein [Winogradskyella sp.]
MANKNKYIPLLLGVAIATGVFIGGKLNFTDTSDNLFTTNSKKDKLNRLIDYIDYEYVDAVNTDSIVDVTVNGILDNLDPHSTLKNVDPTKLEQAKTLKDSMNLAVQYNLEKTINTSALNEDEDIAVNINETVVMISISDKMLFNSGSYRISSKANTILQKLADVINSEASIDVMVEGHTDSRTINTDKIADNWDLSVLRATSVIRQLQNKYKVNPVQLIASGRSSYQPLVDNNTRE